MPTSRTRPSLSTRSISTVLLVFATLVSAASDVLLTRTAPHASRLALPFVLYTWAGVAALGTAVGRAGRWAAGGEESEGKGEEQQRRRKRGRGSWALATVNVANGVLRTRAARWNAGYVWMGVQVYVPLALVFLASRLADRPAALDTMRQTELAELVAEKTLSGEEAPSRTFPPPRRSPSPARPASALPALPLDAALLALVVGAALLFLTDLASARGVILAVALAAVEAVRWLAVGVIGQATDARDRSALARVGVAGGALASVAWRSFTLQVIAHLALSLLAPDAHFIPPHTPSDRRQLAAGAVLGVVALIALQTAGLSTSRRDVEEEPPSAPAARTAARFIAGRNALALAVLGLTGQESRTTSGVRGVLFVTYLAYLSLPLVRRKFPDLFDRFSSSVGALDWSLSSSTQFNNLNRRLTLATLLPLLLWFLTLLFPPCTLNLPFTPSTCHTVDLVIAHYDRPLDVVREHIELVKTQPLLAAAGTETRVVFYHKGSLSGAELLHGLGGALDLARGDEIVHLPNYGREGSTYLHHLTRRYSPSLFLSTASPAPHDKPLRHLADTTLLLQGHLAYDWIAAHRLRFALSRRTGFLSFGPYLTTLCGVDSHINGVYGGVKTVFREVEGRACKEGEEEDRRLSTYAGQVALSRSQVLKNPKEVYEHLLGWIELPDDDPIHHEWNPSGPSSRLDPAAGHALERSWPIVFRCDDPQMELRCSNDGIEADGCVCMN
ncbi:hypothetical protein JCM10207_002033 [Rhodosporidiobolus poonsookiae]